MDHKDTKQKKTLTVEQRRVNGRTPLPLWPVWALTCSGLDLPVLADVTPLDCLFLLNCYLVKLFYGPYIYINFHLANYSFTIEILYSNTICLRSLLVKFNEYA